MRMTPCSTRIKMRWPLGRPRLHLGHMPISAAHKTKMMALLCLPRHARCEDRKQNLASNPNACATKIQPRGVPPDAAGTKVKYSIIYDIYRRSREMTRIMASQDAKENHSTYPISPC